MLPFYIILLRLVVALLLGALIGIERASNEHAAGIRTNALVALGTALFTIISAYGFTDLLNLPHVQFDPARIASYVVAGIGFLGGGAIFVRAEKEKVKGLTTAAAIWIVAAIGMACGAGMIWEAVVATFITLIVLAGVKQIERIFWPPERLQLHFLRIETNADAPQNLTSQIYETCTTAGVAVDKVELHPQTQETGESIEISCRINNIKQLLGTIEQIKTLSGVSTVQTTTTDIED